MKMKPAIMLIRAYGRDDGAHCIPWGIVEIASYLKKYGFEVTVIDRKDTHYPIRRIIQEISERNIAYVGISAMTTQAKDAEFLCKHLKKCKKNIIVGGLHYSIFPEEGLKIADFVFKGEAERSLLDFLENGRDTRIYESKPLLDLDEIPVPSKDLLSRLYLHRKDFSIMTSRGCSYNCTFCLDKKNRFHKIRYHSVAYVCDLMEMIINAFGINKFSIGDDIFTTNKDRVIEICREIKRRSLKVSLWAFTHAGIDDLELYREMKDAGFDSVALGTESGSDEVLKAMNKQQTVEQVKRTIGIIRKSGLKANTTFMVGNILETELTLKATLALAKELCIDGWVSYAQPFPGTKFYEDCLKYGKLINNDPRTYWNNRITFIPQAISKRKLKYYRDKIARALGCPPPFIIRLIKNIFKNDSK